MSPSSHARRPRSPFLRLRVALALLVLAGVGLGVTLVPGAFAGDGAPPAAPPPPPAAGPGPGAPIPMDRLDPTDPVRLRLRLLGEMDAGIRADAARRHLEARLMLDRVLPIAYMGVDADPAPDGILLTKVYPDTGARAAGLEAGDLVTKVDGDVVDTFAKMGRAVRRHHVGDRVPVEFVRNGETHDVVVVFSKRVEEDEDEDEQYPELERTGVETSGPVSFDFEGPDGSLPDRFVSTMWGHGDAPRFVVTKEDGLSFLRQTAADRTGIRYPMAIVKDTVLGDGVVRVRFRFAGGDQDRAAGILLHYRDEANYLVARANAVEEDLRIFRTVNGVRRTLPGGKAMGVPKDDAWHTLEFRAEGPKLTATMDDGEVQVVAYDTYLPAGRVGLWTKSDAVSDFDDLVVEPAPTEAEDK